MVRDDEILANLAKFSCTRSKVGLQYSTGCGGSVVRGVAFWDTWYLDVSEKLSRGRKPNQQTLITALPSECDETLQIWNQNEAYEGRHYESSESYLADLCIDLKSVSLFWNSFWLGLILYISLILHLYINTSFIYVVWIMAKLENKMALY